MEITLTIDLSEADAAAIAKVKHTRPEDTAEIEDYLNGYLDGAIEAAHAEAAEGLAARRVVHPSPQGIPLDLANTATGMSAKRRDRQNPGTVTLKLADGWELRSGVYDPSSPDARTCGEWVALHDPAGNEYAYWDQSEWEQDPALVMGAIINSAAGFRVLPTVASQLDVAIQAIDSEDLAKADVQLQLLLAEPDPLIADTLQLADRALGDQLLDLAVDHLRAARRTLEAAV